MSGIDVRDRLPWGALLALSASGFLAIFTETIPAGLLPELSAGLGVSESAAGQLVTLYALGSVVAAIPLVSATRSMSRKRVLVMAVVTLGMFNFITAIAPWYPVILVARAPARRVPPAHGHSPRAHPRPVPQPRQPPSALPESPDTTGRSP